jgi:hypothetical protein
VHKVIPRPTALRAVGKNSTGNITLPFTCEARTDSMIIMAACDVTSIKTTTPKPMEILKLVNEKPAEIMEFLAAQIDTAISLPGNLIQTTSDYLHMLKGLIVGISCLIVLMVSLYLLRHVLLNQCKKMTTCRKKNSEPDAETNEDLSSSDVHNPPMTTTTDEDYDTTSPGRNKTDSSLPMSVPRNSTFNYQEQTVDTSRRNSLDVSTSPIPLMEHVSMQERHMRGHMTPIRESRV